MRVEARVALLALASAGASCASAPLAPEARAVLDERPSIAWREARLEDFDGLFEAERVEGEAAGALRKLWYHFERDGSYSGAALVFDGEHARFQTLGGRWSLLGDQLDLGSGERARVRAADGWLRVESAHGLALLRRITDT